MNEEKRKYRRIATDVSIRFSREKVDRASQQYLTGVAENCGLGGMFITTEHLFPKGSVIKLEFRTKSDTESLRFVQARAIVRWVRRWNRPRGMGVEFIEFEGLGNRDFAEWIESIFKEQ